MEPKDTMLAEAEALTETTVRKPGANVAAFPTPKQEERRLRFKPITWRDPALIPRRQWLYPRLFVREFLTVTIAPGGVGKSGLTLIEALAMASGRDLLGDGHKGPPLRVWIWNGEDPYLELERQLHAAMIHFNLTPDDIGDRLFMDSGHDMPISLARVAKGETVLNSKDIDDLTREIEDRGVDVALLDPFVTLHSVPESSNDAIDDVATALAKVANTTGAAIGIVAHSRKQAPGSNAELTADDNRGASALVNKARVARVLNRMTKEEAEQAGIEPNARLRYFRVGGDGNKQNLTPPSEDKSWRYNASVTLPNGDGEEWGDSVRVVTQWLWPDPFENVSTHHLELIRQRIQVPPQPNDFWRRDVQSSNWAGHLVAEIIGADVGDKSQKDTVTKVLKTWIENGILKVETLQCSDRKSRPCVVLGEGKKQ